MTKLPSLGPRGEGWVLIQGILFVLIVAAGFSVNGAWAREARTVTTALGLLLVVSGALLAARGVTDLRDAMTPLPRPRVNGHLVQSGAYALVRHPIYGGLVLAALGWGLFTASPIAIGLTVLLLVFFRLKSAREEAWLTEAYPDYREYRARTRRMIPFVY